MVKFIKSRFATMCLPQVLPITNTDHNGYVYLYHENFEMLLDGMRKFIPQMPSSTSSGLLKMTVCEDPLPESDCPICTNVMQRTEKFFGSPTKNENSMICSIIEWPKGKRKEEVQMPLEKAKQNCCCQLTFLGKRSFTAKI